jgi:transcriptional regulator with XRE-family HTH domain
MTKIQECLAQNIKHFRKMRHLTQEQLAEKVETSTNYIGTIEIGKKFPSPQMLERIAEALNIDSLQLFQADTKFTIENPIDIETLKNTLLTNISKAIDNSLEKI